jgi:hypothetical protein
MHRLPLILVLASALMAQQEPGPGAQPGRPGQGGPFLAQFYELRVARIQQTLGFSEDRARVLAERWGRWDRDFIDRGRQMNQLRNQFNQALMGAGSEDDKCARIKPLVDKFLDLRRQQEDGKRRFEADLLQSLTPAQQARMILLVEDIQTRIRESLREAQRRNRNNP